MVDIRVENQESVSMLPNRTRLRIGLWALALILLGFTIGLKVDDLPTFNAATELSTNSESKIDTTGLDPLVQNMLSDGFIESLKGIGGGNIYLGIQKLIGDSEASVDSLSRSIDLSDLVVGKALAQAPPCSSTYQDVFETGFYGYLDEQFGAQIARDSCIESVKVAGKISYSIYKKDGTYYATYYITNYTTEYTRWVKQSNGDCKKVVTKSRPINGTPQAIQINPDGTFEFIGGIPSGAKLICSGAFSFSHLINNPKFDKEKCCGKSNIPPTNP